MSDYTSYNPESALARLQVIADEIAVASTAAAARQALDTLISFAGGTDLAFEAITAPLLADWASWLIFQGYSLKTITYYLKHLSALYSRAVDAGLASSTDAFSVIRKRIADNATLLEKPAVHQNPFARLRQLLQRDYRRQSSRLLARDILLYAIAHGGMTLSQIAAQPKATADSAAESVAVFPSPLLTEIHQRYCQPRRKYLFPLNQSAKTPAQLRRLLHLMLSDILSLGDLPILDADPELIATHLWSLLAMQRGLTASAIAEALPTEVAARLPLTILAAPDITERSERAEAIDISAEMLDLLTENPLNWYAMQLRPRVSADMLTRRLADRGITLPQTFSPQEEIVRRSGHRLLTRTRPYISGVIFFRAQPTQLTALFAQIGDLAWCYRQNRDLRSPYAVIPPAEIMRFQTAIATFPPDPRLTEAGATPLRKGDRVVIIGGIMAGRQAIFDTCIKRPAAEATAPLSPSTAPEAPEAPGRTIYRVHLLGDHPFEWAVDADPRLIRPLSEAEKRASTPC